MSSSVIESISVSVDGAAAGRQRGSKNRVVLLSSLGKWVNILLCDGVLGIEVLPESAQIPLHDKHTDGIDNELFRPETERRVGKTCNRAKSRKDLQPSEEYRIRVRRQRCEELSRCEWRETRGNLGPRETQFVYFFPKERQIMAPYRREELWKLEAGRAYVDYGHGALRSKAPLTSKVIQLEARWAQCSMLPPEPYTLSYRLHK